MEERIATSAAARDDGDVHLLPRERHRTGCYYLLARRADGRRPALDSKINYCVRPRIDAGLPGSLTSVPVLVTVSPSTRSTEMSESM